MNFSKFIAVLVCSALSWSAHAQSTSYFLINAGYEYHNRSYGNVGGSIYWVQPNENVWSLSAYALMGSSKGDFIVIPEVELGYTFTGKNGAPYQDIKGSFYKISLGITPYSIKPKLGISILNVWDIYAGYGWEFNTYDKTSNEGFLLGTRFQIPIQIFAN